MESAMFMEAFKVFMSYVMSLIIIIIIGHPFMNSIENSTPKEFIIIYTKFLGSLFISIALTISYYWDVTQDFFIYGTFILFILGIFEAGYNNKILHSRVLYYTIYTLILFYIIPFSYDESGGIALFYLINFVWILTCHNIVGFVFPSYKKEYDNWVSKLVGDKSQ